jgi:hypothetical protein
MAILIAIGLLALVAALATGSWRERARLARQLREAPRVDIGALAEGAPARIIGAVVADETLRAPFTGRPCVAYVAEVDEYVSRGKSHRWESRIHEVRHLPFVVDDGTGRALVDPGQAKLLVEIDTTTRSGAFDDATEVERAFLDRHGMNSKGWFFNRRLRYREGVIEPGERVAVLGRGVREPDPDAVASVTGYRDALPTRVRMSGSPEHPLLVSDQPDTTR